jgi:hypothetical protein
LESGLGEVDLEFDTTFKVEIAQVVMAKDDPEDQETRAYL